MIALLSAAAWAGPWDGAPQWDDPVTDRAPREGTVSLSQGLVFGPTHLSNTRLQIGLTPYSRTRFGFGITAATQLNGLWIPSEDRASAAIGGSSADAHVWFAPGNRPRTSHDVYFGATFPGPSGVYLVRIEDAFVGFRLGYAGYYDVSEVLDASLDLRLAFGTPAAFGFGGGLLGGNLTVYGSPNKESWVALAGVDASATLGARTVALVAGVRKRFGGAWELGGAVLVPVDTLVPLDGEIPLWPTAELRARF